MPSVSLPRAPSGDVGIAGDDVAPRFGGSAGNADAHGAGDLGRAKAIVDDDEVAGDGHVLAVVAGAGDGHRLAQATGAAGRSEEHTSELQSPYVISYAVFCLKKKH